MKSLTFAKHIDTVIGMRQAVGDQAELQFAIGFYDALGNRQNYSFAYDWGCTAITMEANIEFDLNHNPS